MNASATSSNVTGRPSAAASVVSPLSAPRSLLTTCTIACDPSSRIDPCCKNAWPRRTWAEPTSLRSPTSTSPPTGVAKQGPGRSRAGEGERRIETQRLEGRGEPGVNRAVGFTQAAERRDRGGHRVGHLMLVPYGPAARGASHHVEPPLCEGRRVVAGGGRLVPAQREARRVEAIEAQQRAAGALGFLEQPLVERHVLRARTTVRLDEQIPGDCWGGRADSGTGGQ